MTLHAVIGEGSIQKRELLHQFDELAEKAGAEESNFWFLIAGKETPTQADKDMVEYFTTKGVYFATLAVEGLELDELYSAAEVAHVYEGEFPAALVEAMTTLQEEGDDGQPEGADLLTLLINPKDDDPEDGPAVLVIEAVIDAEFHAFGLNDSMEEITLEEEAPAPPKPPAKTGGAKKAASAKPVAAVPEPAESEEDNEPVEYSREYLEALSVAEVKALAQGMGITGKSKKENVDGILEQQDAPAASAPPAKTQGVLATRAVTTGATGTTTNVSYSTTVNGWQQLNGAKVLVVVHSPEGVYHKMVDAAVAAAL